MVTARHRLIRATHGPLAVPWLCLALVWPIHPAAAQEGTTSQPASQVVAPPAPSAGQPEKPQTAEPETAATDLKRETIQDRLAQIQAATDISDADRAEMLSLYRQAQEQLTVAESLAAKIQELQIGRERAPELLKELKARAEQATSQPSSAPVLEVPAEETLEALTQQLAIREAELRAAQEGAKKLDEEADNRAARRAAIPDLLSDANQRLEKNAKDLSAPPPAGASPQVVLARRTLLLAQKKAIEQEIKEYEEELRFYEARGAVLAAKREVAKAEVAAAQAVVTAWQDLVAQRRQAEIERQKAQAEEELRRAPEPVRSLVERNAALTEEWATVDKRIQSVQESLKTVTELTEKLTREFADLQKREREGPDTLAEIVGPEMRRKRADLLLLRNRERELRALKKEAARAERRTWEIEEEALELTDVEARVKSELEEIAGAVPGADLSKIGPRVQELYVARRETLRQLQPDYYAYSGDLRELGAAQGKLLAKVEQFQEYIDEHILWLRSAGPLPTARLPEDWPAYGPHWLGVGRSMLWDLLAHPVLYGLAVFGLVMLVALRPRVRAAVVNTSQGVSRPLTDSYSLTLEAAGQTLFLSLPWPAVAWFVGWRIGSAVDVNDADVYELAQATASGLRGAALVAWTLLFLRQACGRRGLAEVHFHWEPAALRLTRRNLSWLAIVAALVAFVVSATERHAESAWQASTGRVAFLVGMVALAVFVHRLHRPAHGVLRGLIRGRDAGWLSHLRSGWYFLAVTGPLALAIASAAGYHYTAVQLTEDLVRTAWLGLGLLFLHAMLVRWLLVTQRRIAIEQARKKRAAAGETKPADRAAAAEALTIEERKLDLVSIGDQARRLLRTMTVFALAVGLWGIWADMLPALNFMNRVELWANTVAVVPSASPEPGAVAGAVSATTPEQRVQYITLAHLSLAIVVAVVTYILAKNIPGLLEITILQQMPLDAGARYAVTALGRYTIVVVGSIVAFGAIGVGWSKVQWLVAAMTVGLAFGLQEIFANFVSGLMLLFERPVRIGDTVTIGNVSGTVTRIRIRATTITDWDRKELIIPNKTFVTGQVINWTLSDSIQRLVIPVGLAQGSDTDLAERLLYKVARETADVLAEPKPRVLFMGFGDSSLNFELRAFVAGVDYLLGVRHELHKAIDREFREAGVEIAFPQRDIHVRSVPHTLPIVQQPGGNTDARESLEQLPQTD